MFISMFINHYFMKGKTLLLLIPASVIVAILFIGSMVFFDIPVYPISEEICGCHHTIPVHFFLLLGILFILAIIPISYFISSRKMEKRLDKHMKVLSKFIGKNKEKQKTANLADTESFLKFLSFNEQKILRKLLEGKGEILQSEISRMDNMTKLKVHRAVKNLEQKGIIKTQVHGKTKKISLTKEIKTSLNL